MKIRDLTESTERKADWFAGNIEQTTLENDLYRNVLYTGNDLQLVVMSIEPGSEIGTEVHESGDQFIRVEAGQGEFVIAGQSQPAADGDSILIPAGVEHNVRNTGDEPLKLYALYAPPEHPEGTQQEVKDVSESSDPEDFDSALESFSDAVKSYLSKRAEAAYRKEGEPWDSRINELADQYLSSLKQEDLRNWIRYSFEPTTGSRVAAFFVLKSDSGKHSAGDVFFRNSQGRPDTSYKVANIFDEFSVEEISKGR